MDKQGDKRNFFLNVGFFSIAICIALFVLYISGRSEPLTELDLSLIAKFIIAFGLVGLACLLYALVMMAINAFGNKERDRKEADDSKPNGKIDLKADTTDIAKMNSKQLAVFKELLSKMPDKKQKKR